MHEYGPLLKTTPQALELDLHLLGAYNCLVEKRRIQKKNQKIENLIRKIQGKTKILWNLELSLARNSVCLPDIKLDYSATEKIETIHITSLSFLFIPNN